MCGLSVSGHGQNQNALCAAKIYCILLSSSTLSTISCSGMMKLTSLPWGCDKQSSLNLVVLYSAQIDLGNHSKKTACKSVPCACIVPKIVTAPNTGMSESRALQHKVPQILHTSTHVALPIKWCTVCGTKSDQPFMPPGYFI